MGREDDIDVDMTGEGAWICMERARVAAARTGLGTRPRRMVVNAGGDEGVGVDGDNCADLVVTIRVLKRYAWFSPVSNWSKKELGQRAFPGRKGEETRKREEEEIRKRGSLRWRSI